MNKIYISLISLIFFSCYSARDVKIKKFKFNSNVEYHVSKLVEKNSIESPYNKRGRWQAEPNDKFVLIDFVFNNTSIEKELINLENIYLFNPETNMQFKANWYLASGAIKKMESSIFEIKGTYSIKKTLVFLFPRNEEVIYLKVNNSFQVLE